MQTMAHCTASAGTSRLITLISQQLHSFQEAPILLFIVASSQIRSINSYTTIITTIITHMLYSVTASLTQPTFKLLGVRHHANQLTEVFPSIPTPVAGSPIVFAGKICGGQHQCEFTAEYGNNGQVLQTVNYTIEVPLAPQSCGVIPRYADVIM